MDWIGFFLAGIAVFAGLVLLLAAVQWLVSRRPSQRRSVPSLLAAASATFMDDSSMHSAATDQDRDREDHEHGPQSPRRDGPAARPDSSSIALRLARWLRLRLRLPAADPSAYEQVSASTKNSMFVIEGDEDEAGEEAEAEAEAGLQMVDRGAP